MTMPELKLEAFPVKKMHEGCSGCSAWIMQTPMDTRSERDIMIKILDNYIAHYDREIKQDEKDKRDSEIQTLLKK